MNRRCLAAFFAVAAYVGLALSPAADAQDGPHGTLNAVSFRPLPVGAPIFVRPLDDSDENLALKRSFEAVLQARGYALAPDPSGLVLTFETRDQIGGWSDSGRRTVLEFQGAGGREGTEDVEARLKLFDSQRGALLNKGRGGTRVVTPSSYRLEVNIDHKGQRERLWQGWTIADLAHGDDRSLNRAMVPALVDHIGETVRQQSFDLR